MLIGKEKCERKAYPHRVYPDRNRIRLGVNEAKEISQVLINWPRVKELAKRV